MLQMRAGRTASTTSSSAFSAWWRSSIRRGQKSPRQLPNAGPRVLANRDLTRPIRRNLTRDNPWLLRMFGGVGFVVAPVIAIPPLRDLMGFSSVGAASLSATAGLVMATGLWLQVLRRVNNWKLHWAQVD